VALFAVGAIASVLLIRKADVDNELARGARSEIVEGKEEGAHISSFAAVISPGTLLLFALYIVLFHFANGAMLPLAGQYMACIIAAQLVMMLVAKLTGDRADAWGRRPIFLIALTALILRGLLYTISPDPYWIVSVQLLDGIGAGIFGVLWVIVAADLTRGTGRYNLVLGAIATAASLGAALSNFTAGYVVDWTSYPGGFLFLSGWAVVAFLVFYFGVPETRPVQSKS
jgi:MFS family permease